jgi:hypothetical protein
VRAIRASASREPSSRVRVPAIMTASVKFMA